VALIRHSAVEHLAMSTRVGSTPQIEEDAAEPVRAADAEIRRLLAMLPADVLVELRRGRIDIHDPAFMDGLADHVTRLALASPSQGRRLLGQLNRVKKLIRTSLRDADLDDEASETRAGSGRRTGRNDACPCGSGRKFKQCCLRLAGA
jgi:hypothetical protein